MSNRRIWVTKDGRAVKIMDMSDSHLSNAYRMIISKGFRADFIKDLGEELYRRGLMSESFRKQRSPTGQVESDKRTTKKIKKYTILRRPKLAEATA